MAVRAKSNGGRLTMRILIHTPYYPPEIGAPQARLSALAEALTEKGHEVTVLTAVANYPLGRIYPGEPAFFAKELRNGVKVIRTFMMPCRSSRIYLRLFSYLSFFISSLMIGVWLTGKADIVLTESPPLFLGPAGYVISRLKKAKWIFNVSDLWPQSIVEMGKLKEGSWAHRLCLKIEKFCYRKAFAVSGQSLGIVQSIQERFPGVRTVHFSNGVDTGKFSPRPPLPEVRRRLGSENETVVLYAGLLGMAQGLSQILEAASDLKEKENLRFVFLGAGAEKEVLKKQAAMRGLENVTFLEPVPSGEIPDYLNAADIVLVSLGRSLTGAVPSKLYEAMASAKPVILAASGEPAAIVQESQSGFAVNPGDREGLVKSILRLAGSPDLCLSLGQAGRQAVLKVYDRKKIHEKMELFLREQLCR